jgi:plastocyanin/ribosomal protein L31
MRLVRPAPAIAAVFAVFAAASLPAATFNVTVGPGGAHSFLDADSGTSTTRIAAGDTVHWIWGSSFHSTTSGSCAGTVCTADGTWDSGLQNTPFTFDHVFAAPGTFPYFCIAHGGAGMRGTVIVVSPPTHYSVTAPASATTGVAFSVTVAALDAFNQTVTAYRGAVHFTSSDGSAVLPADYTYTAADAGSHTFSVTLQSAGAQTVTATDAANGSITGFATVSVTVPPATHYAVAAPATAAAGTPISVTVTALDASDQTVPGYTGTAHFTSTDGSATLPADYTFTGADAGSHTFSVTLATGGNQTITATDTTNGSITGLASVNVLVATHYSVTAPATATAGTPISVTVTALDASDQTFPSYTGTAHFTSTDGSATLPADYTFTGADAGTHTFSVTLATAGNQTITATDIADGSITGLAGVAVEKTTVLKYHTIAPCRLVDTRRPAGTYGGPALQGGGATRDFPAAGQCGIAADAMAIAVNVTVISPTASGDLRFFQTGVPAPGSSVINFGSGVTRANNGIVPLTGIPAGSFTVQCDMSGSTDAAIDIVGYFD